MFWCGISISLWMSEWDCQNFEESKQDENSREPMLISLLLYTHFKISINLDRMFWLYSLYSMDQLTCGSVESESKASFIRSGLICPNVATSLFQALCQCGRLKMRAGGRAGSRRERGSNLSVSLPDPARRWSRLSPPPFFGRPHWPRAWNRLCCNKF